MEKVPSKLFKKLRNVFDLIEKKNQIMGQVKEMAAKQKDDWYRIEAMVLRRLNNPERYGHGSVPKIEIIK